MYCLWYCSDNYDNIRNYQTATRIETGNSSSSTITRRQKRSKSNRSIMQRCISRRDRIMNCTDCGKKISNNNLPRYVDCNINGDRVIGIACCIEATL